MTNPAPGPLARISSASLLLALAACATPPPPVISLEGRSCTAELDLASARPLVLAGGSVKVTLDQAAPCIEAGGTKSTYLSFRLPDATEQYIVSVSSEPLGQGLFAPHLLLLDEAGRRQRELPRDSFLFHGPSLAVSIRVHPGERFLVVASDSEAAGQQISRLVASTQVTTAGGGGIYFSVHTGAENTNSYTYAHNGVLTVSAEKIPKVN